MAANVEPVGRTASHERPREGLTLFPQYRGTGPVSMLRGMDAIRPFRTDFALGQLALLVEIVRGDKDRIASLEWSSVLQRVSNGRLTTIDRVCLVIGQEPTRLGGQAE